MYSLYRQEKWWEGTQREDMNCPGSGTNNPQSFPARGRLSFYRLRQKGEVICPRAQIKSVAETHLDRRGAFGSQTCAQITRPHSQVRAAALDCKVYHPEAVTQPWEKGSREQGRSLAVCKSDIRLHAGHLRILRGWAAFPPAPPTAAGGA